MIVTAENGKETIYTFLDKGNMILRENYKQPRLTPEEIIDMAGTLIDDEIRSAVTDTSHYPKCSEMTNHSKMENTVSTLLLRLLVHLVKTDIKE